MGGGRVQRSRAGRNEGAHRRIGAAAGQAGGQKGGEGGRREGKRGPAAEPALRRRKG